MDDLITSLEYFAISKNEKVFNDDIENIMNKLCIDKEEEDPDLHWEILKSNFTKIKYISQLLNHYHYILPINFFDLLNIFIKSLDKTTKIYVDLLKQEICDDDELNQSYEEIKSYFDKSLEPDVKEIDKIKLLLKGYSILVPIIEDFRKEKYYDEKLDPEFVKLYNPCAKRLKK